MIHKLSDLRIENVHQTEDPYDSNALKRLLTEMDRLCGMVLNQDRSSQSKKRYLHSAVSGTDRDTTSDIRYEETIEILHEAIDYIN